MTVKVFWNATRHTWSVWLNGRLWRHMDRVTLEHAKFHVSEAGRQRVIRTGKKNVHATVNGTLSDKPLQVLAPSVRYNPTRDAHFQCNGETIYTATEVYFDKAPDGRPIVKCWPW